LDLLLDENIDSDHYGTCTIYDGVSIELLTESGLSYTLDAVD